MMASASWRSIALRLSPLLREFGIELPAVADIRQCVGHAEIFQALIEPLQFLRAFLHTLLQFTLVHCHAPAYDLYMRERVKERPMTPQQIITYCLALPGAREDFKWGGNRVFSVAGNKIFAIIDSLGEGLAFKVDADLFLAYVDRPGIRPAPYLARARWISMNARQLPLGDDELRQLLTRSHQLVVRKLPKRLQPGLLL